MADPTPGQQDQIDKVTRYWTHARELDGQAAEYRYMAAETITEMVDGGAGVREVARWLGKSHTHIEKALHAFKMCVENDWPPTRFQEAYKHARKPDGNPGCQPDEPEDEDPAEDDDELHPDETPANQEDEDELCPAIPWRKRLRNFRTRTESFLAYDLTDAQARTLAKYLRRCAKELEERSREPTKDHAVLHSDVQTSGAGDG